MKLKTPLDIVTYSPRVQKNFPPPNVNLGPPKISETTRARMLKLKTQLDIVKGYQTFPGQSLSRTDDSRTRRFPDRRFPDKKKSKVKEIIVLIKARSFLDELNLEHLTS